MKHFRKLEQTEVVQTLERVTGVALEDRRLSTLYDILVNRGDYPQVEAFITNSISSESSTVLQFILVNNSLGSFFK